MFYCPTRYLFANKIRVCVLMQDRCQVSCFHCKFLAVHSVMLSCIKVLLVFNYLIILHSGLLSVSLNVL